MSPLPLLKHQIVGGNLFLIFKQALRGQWKDCVAYPPVDWLVKEDTVLQPDFLIACEQTEKPYLHFPPVLVAEILSPSTAIKDRNAKFNIYECQKVKYYLIIDITARKLEVYELIDEKYQPASINPTTFDFALHNNCSVPVSFAELWD